jgi:hypothetical protein
VIIPESDNTIVVGTCSECGGRVCIAKVFMSTDGNPKRCVDCGAVERAPKYGPVIKMRKQ